MSVICMALLSGCTALPGEGPVALDIALKKADSVAKPNSYILVPLDNVVLQKINLATPRVFPNAFQTFGGKRGTVIGVGDRLLVNVWEPSADGVFSTSEKKETNLSVVVDEDGMIFVPYAGRIRASGRKVESLRSAIAQQLTGKAVEPQVQVVLQDNQSNSVVVVGDVAKAGQQPVPMNGLRLLSAIAQAGGAREATYETVATVTRGALTGTVRIDEVVTSPHNNIWLSPGDNVLLLHKPRTYSAFGAVRKTGLIPFKTENLSLTEALAQVGGLADSRADSGGVFLLRFENRDLARWLLTSGQGKGALSTYNDGSSPVIYRLDFRNPQSLFIAQGLKLRDKDIIFVSNHPTAEFGKFLKTVVSPLLGVARTTSALAD